MISISQQLTIFGVATLFCDALRVPLAPAITQPAAPKQPDPTQKASPFRTQMGFMEPRIDLTRDLAAQQFIALLQMLSAPNPKIEPNAAMMSSFSRSSEDDNLPALLLKLSKQAGQLDQAVTVQSEGDKVATVVVETKSCS